MFNWKQKPENVIPPLHMKKLKIAKQKYHVTKAWQEKIFVIVTTQQEAIFLQ